MKVSGFTFIRNAIKYDYPVVESITSILPLCDELIVVVGASDDATHELIISIPSEKIRIIDSIWDESLRVSGKVLSDETNKAYAAVADDADWAIYMQADELMHQDQLVQIRSAMKQYQDNPKVEGLLFSYHHFYGNYDYIGDARKWYPKEVRIIRKRPDIYSYKDAQGFRKTGNKKLNVVPIDANIFHYGWVKPPNKQADKREYFETLYHAPDQAKTPLPEWDYNDSTRLKRFEGTHPQEMQERIARLNWPFNYNPAKVRIGLKERVLTAYTQCTGHRPFEFRNYKIISGIKNQAKRAHENTKYSNN